jgi:hypothetical protein
MWSNGCQQSVEPIFSPKSGFLLRGNSDLANGYDYSYSNNSFVYGALSLVPEEPDTQSEEKLPTPPDTIEPPSLEPGPLSAVEQEEEEQEQEAREGQDNDTESYAPSCGATATLAGDITPQGAADPQYIRFLNWWGSPAKSSSSSSPSGQEYSLP